MATQLPVGGISAVTIDGTGYEAVENITFNPGGFSREVAKSLTGINGFNVTPMEAKVEGTFRFRDGMDVDGINDTTAATVTILMRNGSIITGSGFWTTEPVEIDTKDATFKWTLNGPSLTVA